MRPRADARTDILPSPLSLAEAARRPPRAPRPPRALAWLLPLMRLRWYAAGLLLLAAARLWLGGGGIWRAALLGWLLLHYAAYRAWHHSRHAHEAGLLRRICEPGGEEIASFYRREKKKEREIANPLPDLKADFGGRRVAEVDPAHHLRKRLARRWLKEVAPPGARAADVGCLAGEVSAEHVRAGHEVFLFDLDTLSLRRVTETTRRPAVQADAAQLPVRPGAFELITFLEVAEHLADPARAMREIAAALAPGGRLIASTDNTGCLLAIHLLNPIVALERVAGAYFPAVLPPRSLLKEDRLTGKVYPHASFDSAQVRALAEGAGLRLLWLRSYYFLPGFHRIVARLFPACTEEQYARFALPVEVLFRRIPLLARLGTHWVFACEKPRGEGGA
ncbi:MAG: class I SAM-dependent methyltransferase [Nitrospinota bacterium]